MRFFVWAFCIYIVTLNVLPCTDAIESSKTQTSKELASAVSTDHSESERLLDLCPPFCTCHCCHVHTVNFASAHINLFNTTINSRIFLHLDSIGQEPILSLLDPPRI